MEKRTEEEKKGSYRDHNYIPTGKLKFFIKTSHREEVCYEETERKKLEDKMPFIIKGILKAADSFKKERFQNRIYQRQERERQQKAYQEQERQRKEKEKKEIFMAHVNNWYRAETIRSFLANVKNATLKRHGHIDEGSEMDLWLKWGLSYADDIDPLPKIVG